MSNNPWNVLSLEAFHFYCCPECESKHGTKDQFVEHATSTHPKAREAIMTILDSNVTISNVQPISEQIETEQDRIKVECSDDVDPISEEFKQEIIIKTEDNEYIEPYFREVDIENITKNGEIEPMTTEFAEATTVTDIKDTDKSDPISKEYQQERSHVVVDNDTMEPTFDEVNLDDSISIKTENIENIEPDFHAVDIENITKNKSFEPMTIVFSEDCNEVKAKPVTDPKGAIISNIHKEEKKFKCDQCSERYRHKRHLDLHVQTFHIHVNEKHRHVCHQCSDRYRLKGDLDEHIQMMHPETYNCDQCDKTYSSKEGLRYHTRTKHRIRKVTKHRIPGMYKCDKCDKTYSSTGGLRNHKMTNHRRTKSYGCHLCTKTCKSQSALEYHLQSFHYAKEINQLFKCDHCSFTSFYRPQLRDHTQIRHNK